MTDRTLSRALLCLVVLGGVGRAHADPNVTLGGEYEFSEGVTAYEGGGGSRTAVVPETILDERFLCTKARSKVVSSWPLVSFTHDMRWGKRPIRTLEIVTGPVADGDTETVAQMSEVVTGLYQFLVAQRLEGKCDATLIKGTCLVSLKDILLAMPGLTNEGCGGDFPAQRDNDHRDLRAGILFDLGDLTTRADQVNPQITIGIKTAALITIEPDKLFGYLRSGKINTRQKALFGAIKTEVVKIKGLDAAAQSRVLYATYAIMSHLVNEPLVVRNGDGFHDPTWKNNYGLYPKTSVQQVVRDLFNDISSAEVYDSVVATVNSTIDREAFIQFWRGMRKSDKLEQAKPSASTDVLLLEVRTPAERHIKVDNMTNKKSLTIEFTGMKWD